MPLSEFLGWLISRRPLTMEILLSIMSIKVSLFPMSIFFHLSKLANYTLFHEKCFNRFFNEIQPTPPVNSFSDISDLRLIRMQLRPPFRDDQCNIIRLIRISHYSYHFIRSLAIRISRIPLYTVFCILLALKLKSVFEIYIF